ncbi:Uncharacterised protein [Chlamydia trachomatis]|nr:Uncharacterised protein [Chlamydia trachomatis]
MRFVDSRNTKGLSKPVYGDSFCIVDTNRLFSYRAGDWSSRRKYAVYVKAGVSADEWFLSSYAQTYDSRSPCENYETFSVQLQPSTHFFTAELVTDALLCTTIICSIVWIIVRPIFPRRLRSDRR